MATRKKVVKKKATYKTLKEKGKAGTYKVDKETSGEIEQLDAKTMKVEDVHRVAVSMGLTRNLGDFESTKIQVTVDYPCEEKDIEATFKHARSFCELKVNEFNTEVDVDLGRA